MGSLLLITPLRDEEDHLERTVRAVAAQTRPPDLWLAIDDGSGDRGPELLRELAAEVPFLRVLAAPPDPAPAGRDRLAAAAEAIAFNRALATVDASAYEYVGKLDADVELPPGYFEGLLARFRESPRLGVAGGVLVEPGGSGWRPTRNPLHHVRGALKLYSAACFRRIGGIEERLGWDTIDETYARMRGYETRSFPELVARHHRRVGSRSGMLRGCARHGECAYVNRYPPAWVLARSLKVGARRPYGLTGGAFLLGFARAAARSAPRVEDEEFRRFVRAELRDRALGRGPRVAVFQPSEAD